MPSKHPRMSLSREEELFLRHWIYDEAHYRDGVGPAKRLQLEHRVVPADLAEIVAAAMPDPAEQEATGSGPPPAEPPAWPWSDEAFRARLAEARATLSQRGTSRELAHDGHRY
jgi:hypothetical protein